uniref:Uncharacterized protein n=1 Tax=Ciona intestinalis TaxID=7719 RepID=F6YJG1_CIOIN
MASKHAALLQQEGVEASEENDWFKALSIFQQVPNPSSVIWFNIGCCHLQIQQYLKAENAFSQSIAKDKYLVAGYFQLAVSQTHLGNYAEAIDNFSSALSSLRGNPFIDYKQLNMLCKISACDIRLNLALLHIFSGDVPKAREILNEAMSMPHDEDKMKNCKSALDALVNENWVYFGESALERLVRLSSSCLFRPSKTKMEGLKSGTKFMNTATVVSATNDEYSFVGFVGPKKMQQQREKEELFPINAGQSSHSIVPPPLPSVAPPRRTRSNPPTLPPPVPPGNSPSKPKPEVKDLTKLPPKPLKPLDKKLAMPKPIPKPANSKVLSSPTMSPKSSPGKRSPPVRPAKPSVNSYLQCSLSLSLSLPKNKIGPHDNFLIELSSKLDHLVKALVAPNFSDNYQMTLATIGAAQEITSSTWRETYLDAVRSKKLSINITPLRSKELPKTPKPTEPNGSNIQRPAITEAALKPAVAKKPNQNWPPAPPEDADIYVDANNAASLIPEANEDNIYAEAVFGV